MADTTTIGLKVEPWIRDKWLPKQREFKGMLFAPQNLPLSSGGTFEFDAVDMPSKNIAICISTSKRKTRSGKENTGAVHKIRGDMYFLLLAKVERRVIVFTDKDLFDRFEDERINRRRVAGGIEFMHARLPSNLREVVGRIQQDASSEQGGK